MPQKTIPESPVVQIAVPAPLHRLYDYLPPESCNPEQLQPGVRVTVPFGRSRKTGVLVSVTGHTTVPANQLKSVEGIIDDKPVFNQELMSLLQWAAAYYHHPPGEVFASALPKKLRQGALVNSTATVFRISSSIPEDLETRLQRAPRQAQLVDWLGKKPAGVTASELRSLDFSTGAPLKALLEHGWVTQETVVQPAHLPAANHKLKSAPTLNSRQQTALDALTATSDFSCSLLFGVTGSGKTEVYFRHISHILAQGQQTLVLVPEISLTPQLLARFEKRFHEPIAVLHSGLSDTERLRNWRAINEGVARIVIGTRSAVFAPLQEPGLIIIDEEHDSSLKQQEGFRYSARDLAIVRAKALDIPVVLGTATPSLESLNNALSGRYELLRLPERAGTSSEPQVELIDLRDEPSRQGLSTRLIEKTTQHLKAGSQVLFFLNRRGYAPAWYCNQCGWIADCTQCDAHMTYHQKSHSLRCHHCAAQTVPPEVCPECEQELHPIGQGTERIEEELQRLFPDYACARMDRDVVRSKKQLDHFIDRVRSGEVKILIGTQMLAKGHHFPDVTLVAILNADQGLFGIDIRSTEKLAQTIVQVSGRAGRAEKPGEVLIQTSFPEHTLLQTLIHEGYEAFAQAALQERNDTHWPPFSHLALLRARSSERRKTLDFLQATHHYIGALAKEQGIRILGPVVAPMARRAGQQHGQLLFQSQHRHELNRLLKTICRHLTEAPPTRGVRWSLDVDPVELF